MQKLKKQSKSKGLKPRLKTVEKKLVKKTLIVKKVAKQKVRLSREEQHSGLSLPVFDTSGNKKGKTVLPEEIFGGKVNTQLLSQSIRVYLANQREGSASTKTRGQVEGSTRKIYRQKGTGRARHGGIRAPIFVGGGVAFGPKPRDYRLELPKKMKRVALASALASQLHEGNIVVVDGLTTLRAKTREVVQAFRAIGLAGTMLLVTPKDAVSLTRSARNIDGMTVMPVDNLHPYAVLSHRKIIFTKESLPILKVRFAL